MELQSRFDSPGIQLGLSALEPFETPTITALVFLVLLWSEVGQIVKLSNKHRKDVNRD